MLNFASALLLLSPCAVFWCFRDANRLHDRVLLLLRNILRSLSLSTGRGSFGFRCSLARAVSFDIFGRVLQYHGSVTLLRQSHVLDFLDAHRRREFRGRIGGGELDRLHDGIVVPVNLRERNCVKM